MAIALEVVKPTQARQMHRALATRQVHDTRGPAHVGLYDVRLEISNSAVDGPARVEIPDPQHRRVIVTHCRVNGAGNFAVSHGDGSNGLAVACQRIHQPDEKTLGAPQALATDNVQ